MPPTLTPAVQAFMAEAEQHLGALPAVQEVFAFGDHPQLADALLQLVLRGLKTATCTWPPESATIAPGDLSVVLNGAGEPAALIRTTELRRVPFLQVDAAFAYDEGEDDRTLHAWREAHRRYFTRQRADRPFTDDEEVLCERFEVIHARP
ncbi:ASCH domain-containing protein [Deinococcus maricopensis]|uniref:ASCH domain protein n=1 Tax=Deinococcus maricopensis (strain DSM 21211 / LMG 22137 / NRRL B-23946 / LB-34) TaxID=709986 RepID=E8UC35_DEIML|nr:ASCH domain-containing protein [Deinococcus maricopensis]ADV68696.1 ASCH domain protein [Deinococcus maricopensis DSM 21211]